MSTSYFGLICPDCGVAYPLGTENKRDWRYGVGDLRYLLRGRWELHCVHCGLSSHFDDFTTWQPEAGYTAAQMAVAGQHVRRVRARRDLS